MVSRTRSHRSNVLFIGRVTWFHLKPEAYTGDKETVRNLLRQAQVVQLHKTHQGWLLFIAFPTTQTKRWLWPRK